MSRVINKDQLFSLRSFVLVQENIGKAAYETHMQRPIREPLAELDRLRIENELLREKNRRLYELLEERETRLDKVNAISTGGAVGARVNVRIWADRGAMHEAVYVETLATIFDSIKQVTALPWQDSSHS